MPKRPAPGDRDKIEAVLAAYHLPPGATLLDALNALQELADVANWQSTPHAAVFQHAAAILRALELHRAGMAPAEAVQRAAIQLGLQPDTVRSWLRRWPGISRGGHNARTEPTVSCFLELQAERTPQEGEAA